MIRVIRARLRHWLVAFLTVFPLMALAEGPSRAEIEATMKEATRFMREEVSFRGGYLWSYLPDFSRVWGELEARRTMIWIQPPGTATVGHLYLDALAATGDHYYYEAAQEVANALIWAQHPSGGWNYVADYAGEESLKHWYNTVGKNAWRLEEFQHYYGNATFDDAGTMESAKFLLRLYMTERDPRYRPALERAIQFVLDSQYPIGGWPQRYPLRYEHSKDGQPDYTSFITFNDDVAQENIEFLLLCYQALGRSDLREPVIRAMNSFLVTRMGPPQPGWAMQYTLELEPAGARTYEPKSLSPGTTAANIYQLITFYRLTGETKFLAPIPAALDWLDRVRLPAREQRDGRTHPTFVEIGTGKALHTHRRGSNVSNGEYFADYNPDNALSHYRSTRHIDVEALRSLYRTVKAMPREEATRGSPLLEPQSADLPRFFTLGNVSVSDLNTRAQEPVDTGDLASDAARLRSALNDEGYWPTPLHFTSNPYIGPAPKTAAEGDFGSRHVGDQWDTSPYRAEEPVMGISTGAFIRNMGVLIRYLEAQSE